MSLFETIVATVIVVTPPTAFIMVGVLWYYDRASTMVFKKVVGWSLTVLMGQNVLGTWGLLGWNPSMAVLLMWLAVLWIVPAVMVPAVVDPEFRQRLADRQREQREVQSPLSIENRDEVRVIDPDRD